MDVLFLGTSAAVPSKQRSTSGVAVREGSDVILMDCGEGTQMRLMSSPVSFMRIRAILITHMHGDHVFGLPGLLQTMGLSDRRDPLYLYGPPGLAAFVESMMSATEGELPYDLVTAELEGGEEFRIGSWTASCYRTVHGMFSLGYVLREPDRPGKLDRDRAVALGIRAGPDMARLKRGETVNGVRPEDVVGPSRPGLSLVYTGDTRPCGATVEAASGADVLIHESTYMDTEASNAENHNHSTASQAAGVARDAGVRYLLLTHVSHRYDDRALVEEEAQRVFPDSYVADDLWMYEVTASGIRASYVGPEVR